MSGLHKAVDAPLMTLTAQTLESRLILFRLATKISVFGWRMTHRSQLDDCVLSYHNAYGFPEVCLLLHDFIDEGIL